MPMYKQSSDQPTLIIGAGIAGLATGCYAQMNGYRTRIFEQHALPGGVCTAWQRQGFTLDGCIHFLMGCHPDRRFYRQYREVGALAGNRLIHAEHYLHFLDEATGREVSITRDLAALARDLNHLAPRDGAFTDRFIAGIRAMQGYDVNVAQARSLMRPIPAPSHLWNARHLIPTFAGNRISVKALSRRVHDPFLAWVVSNLFVPEAPVPFIFAVLAQLTQGELAVVEGGSLKFAQAMAQRYKALGGQIIYNADVREILTEDDRAVGVRLADGTVHQADRVISAADGHTTIFELLKGRYVNRQIRARYEHWPLFDPLLLISYGVAREYPHVPPTNVLQLACPLSIAGESKRRLVYRVFNYDDTLAPTGKTVVQAYVQTTFDWWKSLREENRSRYEAAKAEVAAQVLDRLAGHLPGIETGVEMTDVSTPQTFYRYTRNYHGAFEGWLVTPNTIRHSLEKSLPGLRNFYMIGQWTEPGGGIPPVIDASRRFVEILCKRDGKTFRIEPS